MEERTKAKDPSWAGDGSDIVELTPDMALPDDAPHQIIDLTRTLEDQASDPAPAVVSDKHVQDDLPEQADPTVPEPLEQATETEPDVVSGKHVQDDLPEQADPTVPEPPEQAAETEPDVVFGKHIQDDLPEQAAPTAPEPPEQAPVVEKAALPPEEAHRSAAIEAQVDAAFDAVQAPKVDTPHQAETPRDISDDQLLDELTNVTDLVDKAVGASTEPDSAHDIIADAAQIPETQPPEPPEDTPLIFDEAQLAADAAELDAALAGGSEMEATGIPVDPMEDDTDEPIELTDVVDPAELEMDAQTPMESVEVEENERIIDLTDIVDPSELEAAPIELTDIVDPIELTDIVDPIEADENIIELTDIVDPAELEATGRAFVQTPAVQEEDNIIELTDIVDPAELKGVMAPEIKEPAKTVPPSGPASISDEDEDDQLIQLSDVLRHKTINADRGTPLSNPEDEPDETYPEYEDDDTALTMGMQIDAESTDNIEQMAEEAIQQTVQRLLAKKGAVDEEQLKHITAAVEKAVAKQMDQLKGSLKDDENI